MDGDNSQMNFIRLYTKQIADIKRTFTKPNFSQNRMAVTKWFGPMDPKKTTMSDFLDAVLLMQKEGEMMRAHAQKRNGDGQDN